MSKGQNRLMQCPNYAVCGTMVLASKRGEEHNYEVWNPTTERMERRHCNGG